MKSCREKCNSIKRKNKDVESEEKTCQNSITNNVTSRVTSTADRSKRFIKQSFENIHAYFNKEPGTVVAIDEEYPPYKNFEDYDNLISQLEEESVIEKRYSVVCNVPIKENSIQLDDNNRIKSMIQGSPLNHLLLYGDKIIDYNGVTFSDLNKENSIPKKKIKNIKLTISRCGRSKAIPAMRARKHNLNIDCNNYHYYIFEVPRIVGIPLGFDAAYNSREKDFVVINISPNSIGGILFEQGDHIVDINSTLLSNSEIFSEVLKDPRTYPSFTVLVKKPYSKSSIESTKNFLNSPNFIFIKPDIKEIVEKIEDNIKEYRKEEGQKKTILKKENINEIPITSNNIDTILMKTNENNYKLNFLQPESETIQIESNIQNPLYLENVTKSVKFL